MKKIISMLILALVSTLALALPAPTDIEAAVRGGNLAQAETMLHEVIQAKPGSAKAHYELGQILARQGNNDAARRELAEAERLDPSLKFATDPLRFRNLVNRLSTGLRRLWCGRPPRRGLPRRHRRRRRLPRSRSATSWPAAA